MVKKSQFSYTQTLTVDQHTHDGTNEDAITSITVHHDGILVGIQYFCYLNASATDDFVLWEISKSGNMQGFVSDNPDTLAVLGVRQEVVTTGGGNTSITGFTPMTAAFRSGAKIYLNAQGTNLKVSSIVAILHWQASKLEAESLVQA